MVTGLSCLPHKFCSALVLHSINHDTLSHSESLRSSSKNFDFFWFTQNRRDPTFVPWFGERSQMWHNLVETPSIRHTPSQVATQSQDLDARYIVLVRDIDSLPAFTHDSMGNEQSTTCIVNLQLKVTSIDTQRTEYWVCTSKTKLLKLAELSPTL